MYRMKQPRVVVALGALLVLSMAFVFPAASRAADSIAVPPQTAASPANSAAGISATPIGDRPSVAAGTSRLDEIAARGILRICATGDYKPYTFVKPDGSFEGIDVDLAASLADALKAKPVFVRTTWKNLTPDFIAKCDIAVGGVSVSLERQRQVFFTRPYMSDGKTPIVRCADAAKYQTIADIDKPSVRTIVNPGGTNERFARQNFTHSHLTVYPDNTTIFNEIAEGRADVMVTDASETLYRHKLDPRLCSVHPDQPFEHSEKAFMLPRGDVVYQQFVDQWLHLMIESGEFAKVYQRWL